jgi:hypothetical protein
MNAHPHMQLLTLADGGRILRLEDEATGLTLERKLRADLPVAAQKMKLVRLFEAMLEKEMVTA